MDVNGRRGSELRRSDWNPVAVEKDETGQTLSLAWRPLPLHPRCSSPASVRRPVGARSGDERGSGRGTPRDVNYASVPRDFFFYASRFFYD